MRSPVLVRGLVLIALIAAAVLIVGAPGGILRPATQPGASSSTPQASPASAVPTLAAPPVVAVGRAAVFDPRTTRSPSGSVAQSKVWFNDGVWWGVLLTASGELHIQRLDWASQLWSDTGTLVDERPNARADCLWDGQHLYVASSPAATDLRRGVRLLRFSYDRAARLYRLDPDFPLTLRSSGVDDLVLSRDSRGVLWLAYLAPLASGTSGASPPPTSSGAPSSVSPSVPGASLSPSLPPGTITTGGIWTVHSTTDDLHWSLPAILPSAPTAVDATQLAAIATGTELAIVWTTPADDAIFAARHADGAPDASWVVTRTPVDGAGGASQGISVRSLPADPQRRLFVGLINALDRRVAANPLWPRAVLVVITPDGAGDLHLFGRLEDHHVQPLVLIDAQHRTLYMLALAPVTGGVVYAKSAPVDDIAFDTGVGDPLLASQADPSLTAPSTSKQSPDTASGLLVLASDNGTGHYAQAAMSLGGVAPGQSSAPPSSSPPPAIVVNDVIHDTFDPWTVGGPVPNGWALASGSGGALEVAGLPSVVNHSAKLTTIDARLRARACKSYPSLAGTTITAGATVLVDGVAGAAPTLLAVRGGGGELAAVRFGGHGIFTYVSGRDVVTTTVPYRLDTWYRVTVTVHLDAHRYDLRVVEAASGTQVLSSSAVPIGVPNATASDAVCFATSAGAPGLGLYFDEVVVTRP